MLWNYNYNLSQEKSHMNSTGIRINLMPDNSEIIPYISTEIPIYIRSGWLSMYANMRSLCHWHEDIEFVRIHKGTSSYYSKMFDQTYHCTPTEYRKMCKKSEKPYTRSLTHTNFLEAGAT